MKLALLFLLVAGSACADSVPPSAAATIADYSTAELACVADAGSRAEANACVCQVRANYGRPCDGGTP